VREKSFGSLLIYPGSAFTEFLDLGSCTTDIGLLFGEIDLKAILAVGDVFLADSAGESGLIIGELPGVSLAIPEIFSDDISLTFIADFDDIFINVMILVD